MTSAKNAGRAVGLMLLVQLVTGLILPYVLLKPLTTVPAGFLEAAAGMPLSVRLNVLLLFLGGALTVAIAVAAWPVFRRQGHALGLWLLALSAVNLALQAVENTHWLTMLSVSQAYANAGAAEAASFQTLGVVVRSLWKWAHYAHILAVGGWIFLFHCLLFRGALVPRTLAALGLVASTLQITGITLPVFLGYRMPFPELFGIPLAVTYVLLALWLMAKGFPLEQETRRVQAPGAVLSGA